MRLANLVVAPVSTCHPLLVSYPEKSTWKQIVRGGVPAFPSNLSDEDKCFYAREYHSRKDYSASDGNSLVSNFKMKRSLPSYEQRKRYKTAAAYQFAGELADFLPEGGSVCHVPTSKRPQHEEYDPRFEYVMRHLGTLRPDLTLESPFVLGQSHESAHMGGERTIAAFYSKLKWGGLSKPTSQLFIVDDVITSGSHFKACQQLLQENEKHVASRGIFWALTVDRIDEQILELPLF